MEESTGTAPRKTVYLSLHENFVRENIAYTDRATGGSGPSTRSGSPPARSSTGST